MAHERVDRAAAGEHREQPVREPVVRAAVDDGRRPVLVVAAGGRVVFLVRAVLVVMAVVPREGRARSSTGR